MTSMSSLRARHTKVTIAGVQQGKGTRPGVKTFRKGMKSQDVWLFYWAPKVRGDAIETNHWAYKFLSHPNFNLLRRTSVYSFAIVHSYFLIQMIFISSKTKMHRQLVVALVVPPEGSGDCNPDFTYYIKYTNEQWYREVCKGSQMLARTGAGKPFVLCQNQTFY